MSEWTGNTGSLLAPGSSSFVYCVGKTQAVKKFNSIDDLLNEQTIYDMLPRHPRLVNTYKFGADYMIMDRMPNGDLARFKDLRFGQVIKGCWNSAFTSFEAVLDAVRIEADQVKAL